MGFMESGNTEQYSSTGSSHSWQDEYFSRSIEQNKNSDNRMVFKQGNSTDTIWSLGSSFDRSICLDSQSSDTNILFMDASHRSSSSRCSNNFMGEDVCLCVSPNMPDSQDTAIYEAVPLSDYINCTTMAKETLVCRSPTISDSLSHQTSKFTKSVKSTKNKNLSSTGIQSDCLASINRSFQAKVFSKQARSLLSASWRKGTQKDYGSKFKKYCSWCCTRKINLNSATLNQVADFLSDLFNEGLQYRTIAGYRSMLSPFLPHYENVTID